jgi:HlyD family secretion protein
MDIARPDLAKKKKLKQRFWFALIGIFGVSFTIYVLTLGAPNPTVNADQIWIGKVERGTMERNLRGMGKLVPESVRWLASRAPGKVEERLVLSGAIVEPDTVILRLSNPDLLQKLADSKLELDCADADMAAARVRLRGELLSLKSSVVELREATELAELDARIQNELFADKLVSSLNRERAELHAKHSRIRLEMEEERLKFQDSSIEHQLASQKTRVDRARAQAELLQQQADALTVRAGFSGVLQKLELEPGMQVVQDALLAQVADMAKLKAVIEIQEAQARDVESGQTVLVDTRTSGEVEGKVARVDPNVENGIVRVDVVFEAPLPAGCRAEQTIQGTIRLERLENVVFMPRPASAQPMSTSSVFLVDKDGGEAVRVPVAFGKASVSQIEVVSGLKPGDSAILSDTTRWENAKALKIK